MKKLISSILIGLSICSPVVALSPDDQEILAASVETHDLYIAVCNKYLNYKDLSELEYMALEEACYDLLDNFPTDYQEMANAQTTEIFDYYHDIFLIRILTIKALSIDGEIN